jgi:hypothetical protein
MALLDLATFFLVLYSVSMKFLFYERQFSDHVPFDIAWNWRKVDNDEDNKCYLVFEL